MSATVQVRDLVARDADCPASASDEELLLRYRETEDRDCFAELVRRHERPLYSYLRRYTGSTEMAEDVFQSTFLQVHLKCRQFAADRSFRVWLYAIATNQAIDAQRRRRRQPTVSLQALGAGDRPFAQGQALPKSMLSGDPAPPQQADQAECGRLLRQAVDELSGEMRTVLELVYFEGLKYREAAEVMNVPVGTIKSRVHTAVARLSEIWQRHRGRKA